MTISSSSPSNNGGKTDPGKTDPTLIAHRVYVFIQKLDNKKHASETRTTEAETGVFLNVKKRGKEDDGPLERPAHYL